MTANLKQWPAAAPRVEKPHGPEEALGQNLQAMCLLARARGPRLEGHLGFVLE